MKFTDAAAEVLWKVGQGRAMHYADITDEALRRQLIQTQGLTPQDTMDARIGDEIRTLGLRSRFVRTGRGMIALARPGASSRPGGQDERVGRAGDVIRRPISPAGQITLGSQVRNRWDVDSVLVHDKGSHLVVYPVPEDPIRAARGILAGRGKAISADEARRLGRDEDARIEAERESVS